MRALELAGYRYFAALMNWLKASHHTTTVEYVETSMPAGTAIMKPLNVFTSPMR